MPGVNCETIYTARKFVLEKRTIEIRGKPHVLEVIRHPGAAVVLPLLDDGRIVAIQCYREAVGGYLLEIPAGTLGRGEQPVHCAERELAEETGYRAAKFEPLVDVYPSPGILTEHMHIFVATGLTPGPSAQEAGEDIRLHPITLEDGLAGIRDGLIKDAKTMIAWLYFERFCRKGGVA
jgi:ADP-ribose pyrophosphatase